MTDVRDHEQWEWISFPERVLKYPGIPDVTVGAGTAKCGFQCINTLTGDRYINKGTVDVPDWKGVLTA